MTGVLLALRFCVRLEGQRGEVDRNLESREVGTLYTRLKPVQCRRRQKKWFLLAVHLMVLQRG